jgi:hypothetical protein
MLRWKEIYAYTADALVFYFSYGEVQIHSEK